MENVLTWTAALEKGFEPRLYPYAATEVPMGNYEAKLDFKMWAVRPLTLHCYFTQIDTGKRFQLSVYRRNSDEIYGLPDGDIDFKTAPTDFVYLIGIGCNEKGSVVFESAKILDN
jgi:hypothetical protein